MGITIAGQTVVFLKSCLFGLLLGAFYDVFRTIRLVSSKSVAFILICDIVYWALCGFFTFVFILSVNFGQVRGFIIAGILLGAIFYYNTIGSFVIRFMEKVIGFSKRAVNKIKRVFYPLFSFVKNKSRALLKKVVFSTKKIKKVLKVPNKLLYNIPIYKLVKRNRNSNNGKDSIL